MKLFDATVDDTPTEDLPQTTLGLVPSPAKDNDLQIETVDP